MEHKHESYIEDAAMENINLDLLQKDGERMLQELAAGNMVVARSKNDFLYIIDHGGQFHMFRHSPGAPGGGQKKFPKNEQYTATVSRLADISDAVYLVEYDKSLNLFGVMYTAEEGILELFPGDDREGDGMIDFWSDEET